MNPTTTDQKIELVKGGRRVDNVFQPNTPTASPTLSPLSAPTPTFSMSVPDQIPSSALSTPATYNDVLAKARNAQQSQQFSQQLGTEYDALVGRINSPLAATPFQNPEAFLNDLLLRRPTATENALNTAQSAQSQNYRQFGADYEATRENAREEFDVTGLTSALQETKTRIGERTKKYREELRALEVNASQNAVARPFVEDAKAKLTADATAELADLAIIESAQTGNLDLANQQIDRLLQEKLQSFEFENAAIEAEISRLQALDTKEGERRSEQLQIALQERNRLVTQSLEDEKEKRSYMVQAASNGADQGTLDAIRNATTPGEAAVLAGPWIGRLDRQMHQAQLANIYDQIFQRSLPSEASLKEARELQEKNRQALDKARDIERVATELKDWGWGKNLGARAPEWFRYMTGSKTATEDFDAKLDQLKSILTLDNMDLMTGVLSESDIKILASAATALNVKGSREAFDAELNVILGKLAPVLGATMLQDDDMAEIDAMIGTKSATTPSTFSPSAYFK